MARFGTVERRCARPCRGSPASSAHLDWHEPALRAYIIYSQRLRAGVSSA